MSQISSERTLGVRIALSEGSIEISTDNPAVGEGLEVVDVGYDGEDLQAGFNARYYIDVLNVLEDDEVHLELSGALDPAVVKNSEGTYIGVIMPMRI